MDHDKKLDSDKQLTSDSEVPPEYDLESMCDRRDAAVRNPIVGRHAAAAPEDQPDSEESPDK